MNIHQYPDSRGKSCKDWHGRHYCHSHRRASWTSPLLISVSARYWTVQKTTSTEADSRCGPISSPKLVLMHQRTYNTPPRTSTICNSKDRWGGPKSTYHINNGRCGLSLDRFQTNDSKANAPNAPCTDKAIAREQVSLYASRPDRYRERTKWP